jgi:hypothetical protein
MIKISDVKLNSSYSWGNIAQLKDWNAVRLYNPDWNALQNTVTTGMQITVEVTVVENTWELLKESYPDWQEIALLPNWSALKTI